MHEALALVVMIHILLLLVGMWSAPALAAAQEHTTLTRMTCCLRCTPTDPNCANPFPSLACVLTLHVSLKNTGGKA